MTANSDSEVVSNCRSEAIAEGVRGYFTEGRFLDERGGGVISEDCD